MIYLLLIALAAGAIAGLIIRGKGYGLLLNLLIGTVGGFIGIWLVGELEIPIRGGIMGTLFMAVAGAVGLLYFIHLLKKLMNR
jgi:uncharacterized membrane protein YeaQ/YmgE (transglycosylase-associated protein family)